MQRRVDHLDRVRGLRCLNQAVELAVLAGDERVLASGHVEEGDATGPDVVQPAAVHRADARLWRVEVSRACVGTDLVVSVLKEQTDAEVGQFDVVICIDQ